MQRSRWSWLALAAGLLVIVAVVVSIVEGPRPAANDEVFDVVAPHGRALRQATVLRLEFLSGTCFPGDKEDIARKLNAPLRVEVQDRREAVVVKAHLDRDYVESISPPAGDGMCAGVGLTFTRDITIPRPIGDRALINGGFIYKGVAPKVMLTSRIKGTNHMWSNRPKRLAYLGIDRFGHPTRPLRKP